MKLRALSAAAVPPPGETEADPVAELLHVGHRLVDSMYMPLLEQARARGIEPVIREVERVATQHPLSEPRVVMHERFSPEVIGVGPEWVNPYLSYLMAMLEVDRTLSLEAAQAVDSEAPPTDQASTGTLAGEPVRPVLSSWWSPEVAEALRALAGRAAPTVLAYIENVGQQEEAKDRFQSLLTEGIEARAHRLLTFYEANADAIGLGGGGLGINGEE